MAIYVGNKSQSSRPEDSVSTQPQETDETRMTSWAVFANKYPNLAEAFLNSFQEQLELLSAKMLDYGTGNMKAGTNLETKEDIRFALEGVWFRLNDKVSRWKNLLRLNSDPYNESLYDTFMDIANYAIIAKLISRGLWKDN